MPRGGPPTGLLEQGLVVVEPHGSDAQQFGCDAREAARVNPATAGSFFQMSPTWMKALS
jgi:hypothetical protein